MKVTVNGEPRELAEAASAWETTPLRDGDRLEVLTAVQGG